MVEEVEQGKRQTTWGLDNFEKWELTFILSDDNLTKEEKIGKGGLRDDCDD